MQPKQTKTAIKKLSAGTAKPKIIRASAAEVRKATKEVIKQYDTVLKKLANR